MKDLFDVDYSGPGLAGVDEVGRGPLAGDVVADQVRAQPVRAVRAVLVGSIELDAAARAPGLLKHRG